MIVESRVALYLAYLASGEIAHVWKMREAELHVQTLESRLIVALRIHYELWPGKMANMMPLTSVVIRESESSYLVAVPTLESLRQQADRLRELQDLPQLSRDEPWPSLLVQSLVLSGAESVQP